MDENQIITEIILDLRKLNSNLEKAEASAKRSGRDAGRKFGSNLQAGMGRSLGSLRTQLLGLGTAFIAAFGAKKVIDASRRQQDAVVRLNQALRSSGQFTQEASKDFQEFAAQIQRTSTVGDEAALEVLSLAKAMGATNEQAKELTQAAVELSAATGISLESAAKNLGKTLGGLTGELGEVLPQLKELGPDALKAGAAFKVVNERFKDTSRTLATQTFSGAISQAENAFGDLVEKVGDFITQSPLVVAAINKLSEFLVSLGDGLAEAGSGTDMMKEFALTSIRVASVINSVVTPVFDVLFGVINGLGNMIGGLGAALVNLFSGEFRRAAEIAKQTFLDTANIGRDILDFNSTQSAENFLIKMQEFVEQTREPVKELGRGLASSFQEGAEELSFEGVIAEFKRLSNAARLNSKIVGEQFFNFAVGGIANGMAAIGGALVQGQNLFKAFAGAVLASFGDLLIQLGTKTIASGIAMQSAPVLFGAQGAGAVAAGAAMVAAGGALKAFAAALGGAGSALGGSGSGGGGAASPGGAGLESGPIASEFTEEVERNPQTNVQVVVEGSVFNQKETGLEIARIIQDSFDNGDVKIAGAPA